MTVAKNDSVLTDEQKAIALEIAKAVDSIEDFLKQAEEDLADKKLSTSEAIGLAIETPSVWKAAQKIISNVRLTRKMSAKDKAAIREFAATFTANPSLDPSRVSIVIDFASDLLIVVDKVISKSAKLLNQLKQFDQKAVG